MKSPNPQSRGYPSNITSVVPLYDSKVNRALFATETSVKIVG